MKSAGESTPSSLKRIDATYPSAACSTETTLNQTPKARNSSPSFAKRTRRLVHVFVPLSNGSRKRSRKGRTIAVMVGHHDMVDSRTPQPRHRIRRNTPLRCRPHRGLHRVRSAYSESFSSLSPLAWTYRGMSNIDCLAGARVFKEIDMVVGRSCGVHRYPC